MYVEAVSSGATSWNHVEAGFLAAMSAFDSDLAATAGLALTDQQRTALSGDIQNGKGDFFNDLLALLLENCAEVDTLYTRNKVPGLIVPEHNLDGVYPSAGPIVFLLEAKMMGTPRHALSPRQLPAGRRGSADIGKRVKELAFKSIDLKGEYSRRMTIEGKPPAGGGSGGGDLTTWLRANLPNIYFFIAVRVLNDADFAATIRWAHTAQQVVDAVGVYCYEPIEGTTTAYRTRGGVPTDLELERVLYKACLELRAAPRHPTGVTRSDRSPFGLDDLRSRGFQGFVRVRDLRSSGLAGVPKGPGLYAVVRESLASPSFLAISPASWFKGRDPTVSVGTLEAEWISDAQTLYIGSGNDLSKRISLLLEFSGAGRVRSVFHWGGRLLWQLTDADDLLVAWRVEPGGVGTQERDLVDEFKEIYGRHPFANLKRPPARSG